MNAMDIIYIVIGIAMLVFIIWQRTAIIYSAKRKRTPQIIWSVLALLVAVFLIFYHPTLDLLIGGLFVVIFLIVMAAWLPGLGRTFVTVSLRKIWAYNTFTNFEIFEVDDQYSEVKIYSGDVLMLSQNVKGSREVLQRFLDKKIDKRSDSKTN